jgi:hypothetical protein
MLMFYYFRFALSLANLLGPGYTFILQKLLNNICEHMGSPPGFGWVRVARAPVFSASFWWGPCCSSTWVLPHFLVGSVLLEHMVSPSVFGGVRVARAPVFSPSVRWGPCCSSTCVLRQVLVGSVLLEHLCSPPVFGGVRVARILSFLCCVVLCCVVCVWFVCPMSCVPYVASASGLFILDCPFGFL